MPDAKRESPANARIGVEERVPRSLHVGVAKAGGLDAVSGAEALREQLYSPLRDAVRGMWPGGLLVDQERLHVLPAIGATDVPVTLLELVEGAEFGQHHA